MARSPGQELADCCQQLQEQVVLLPDHGPGAGAPSTSERAQHEHPSIAMLRQVVRLHRELHDAAQRMQQPGSSGEVPEAAAAARRRETVLAQALAPFGRLATSLRAVVADVADTGLAQSNGYVPSVDEVVLMGHRIRYTTFATMGLFSGEPSPQQLHFDASTLWEHHAADQARNAHVAAAEQARRPPGPQDEAALAAEQAVGLFLDGLLQTGWTPEQGIPDYMLQGLTTIAPGALQILQRLVEARFGAPAQQGAEAAPPAARAAAGPLVSRQAPPPPQSQAAKLASKLFLDEDDDSDDDDSGSDYDDDD